METEGTPPPEAAVGGVLELGSDPALAAPAGPPPLPGAAGATWHVAVNGQTQGPFTIEQVTQGISAGQLNRESLVWNQGMTSWTPAAQVPQLTPAFATASPPPPPLPK